MRVAAASPIPTATDWSPQPKTVPREEVSVDAALGALLETLPGCGFRLVLPPPDSDGRRPESFASVWQRGESRATTYAAATPALALLRAVQSEHARRRDRERLQSCGLCGGIGWYMAAGGSKQVCPHPAFHQKCDRSRPEPGAVRP